MELWRVFILLIIMNLKNHRQTACLGFEKLTALAITTPKDELTLRNFGLANTIKVERIFIWCDPSLPPPGFCYLVPVVIFPGPNSSLPVRLNSASSLESSEILQRISSWAVPQGFWFNRSRVAAFELPTVTGAFQKNIRKITLQATILVWQGDCGFWQD